MQEQIKTNGLDSKSNSKVTRTRSNFLRTPERVYYGMLIKN